jgi:hypothetical protein
MFEFVPNDMFKKISANGSFVEGTLTGTLPILTDQKQKGCLAVFASSVRNYIEGVMTHYPNPQREESSIRPGFGDFNATSSWNEAIDIFLNKPSKIRVFSALEKDIKVPQSSGNEVFYDVEGDWLDVDRYLEGQPEVFGSAVMGNPTNIFANVVINLGTSSNVPEESMRRRGERLIRLVDWLENQRIRVRISALASNACHHTEVTVKDHQDNLDLDALAVAVHPDFFRRIVFRQMEHSATWQPFYGYPTTTQRGNLKVPTAPGIMILSENHRYVQDVDKGFDKAETEIEQMLENGESNFSMNL